jgi:hypothetical protein
MGLYSYPPPPPVIGQVAQVVTLVTFARKVSGSYLVRGTDYVEKVFS